MMSFGIWLIITNFPSNIFRSIKTHKRIIKKDERKSQDVQQPRQYSQKEKNKHNEKRKGKKLQSDRKKKIISPTKKEKEKNGGTQTNPDEHGNRRERLNECSKRTASSREEACGRTWHRDRQTTSSRIKSAVPIKRIESQIKINEIFQFSPRQLIPKPVEMDAPDR